MTRASAVVFGGGLSALMASWELCARDFAVTLVSPTDPASWPVVGQGGLSLAEDAEAHTLETLRCGGFAAARAPVRALSRAATALVDELAAVGVPFARKKGRWLLRRLPGMAEAGAVFVEGHTELAIATALERLLAGRYGDRFSVATPVDLVSLFVVDGRCLGIIGKHAVTHEVRAFEGDAVLLAGGGPERVLGARVGTLCLEAPIAVAAAAGAVLANLHRCQRHPGALPTPRGLVIPTAALRSEGATLWVPAAPDDGREPHRIPRKERLRFLEARFPDWAELVPDDRGSAEAHAVAAARAGDDEKPVTHFLDVSHLPEGHLEERVGAELEALRATAGVDPARTAVEVVSAPLGLLGGLWIDHERSDDGGLAETSARNHATSIPGLYAAGPLACLYHGACQLGGNGVLADLVGGRLAARAAAAFVEAAAAPDAADAALSHAVAEAEEAHGRRVEAGYGASHHELTRTLRLAVRDLLGPQEYELEETANEIDELEARLEAMPPEARAGHEGADRLLAVEHMVKLAQLIAKSALAATGDGGVLARRDGERVVSATSLSVDGRRVSALVDADGVDAEPADYGAVP